MKRVQRGRELFEIMVGNGSYERVQIWNNIEREVLLLMGRNDSETTRC